MPLNFQQVRQHLDQFEFGPLFIEELGWSHPSGKTIGGIDSQGIRYEWTIVAQLGGVPVLEVRSPDGGIPDSDRQRAIHREVAKLHHENLLIFVDSQRGRSDWYWVRRENGRETPRSHEYLRGQPGDLFFGKIAPLLFEVSDFDHNGDIEVVKVAQRLKLGLDVEKVTKKFYTDFQQQHLQFLELISGIDDERQLRWYASVLLNRLMFIWFLQRKGFIDNGDLDYLDHKLAESKQRGKDRFFGEFLKLLFFEGFAKPAEERSAEANERLGVIRYLNGGLFLPHTIEQSHPGIDVPDKAFENLFDLFRHYSWNLNDTPGGDANEINPDVLGYIFEKYINQKAFGAYYTRPEITNYLCERTIERLVLDAVNTPKDEHLRALPGKNYDFKSLGDLLLNLDAALCRKLFKTVLPKLSILDPACGSGAFLVAAMKTLIKIYGAVVGQVRFVGDNDLRREIAAIEKTHPNIDYFVKKSIITDNLYGVDIMEEAVEIARLRLFLALVASARIIDHLEPLPNIDFNLLPGNSLIGLMRVDEKKFETGDLFRKSYRQVVDEKNRQVATYRHTASYHDDLRAQRDKIDHLRSDAAKSLDKILLEEFGSLGIKYEEATWDHAKQREGKGKKRGLTLADIRDLQPFHWGYEFDEIVNKRGGFDAILTNPPWDKLKPVAKEFFERHSDLVSKNNMTIHDFETEQRRLLANPEIRSAWLTYLSEFPHQSAYFRGSADYANQISEIAGKKQSSDLNLYKLFVERCFALLSPHGACGMILQGGFHSDLGAKGLRQMVFDQSQVGSMFVLSNERFIFENVDHRQKFCVLTLHRGGKTQEFPAAFRMNPREAVSAENLNVFLHDDTQHVTISLDLIRRLSPESMSVLEFRSVNEMRIAEKLYQFPRLNEGRDGEWNLRLSRELDMTNDSHLFKTSSGKDRLPLYEGKMISQFDCQHAEPRYWIDERDARAAFADREYSEHRFAFREVARSTDTHTMICALLPRNVIAGHTLVLQKRRSAALRGLSDTETLFAVATFNSLVIDWLLRQQVSAHVSMFYVYQLPMPRLSDGNHYFTEIVRRSAMLSCNTVDFADVAEAAGIEAGGVTDPATRMRLQAEIDAIVAHVYGLTEAELLHIVATFPLLPEAAKAQVLDVFRNWKPPSDDPLLKLIAAGESSRIEFKSTARWDLKQNRASKEMEQVIVKTVAALMNSEGGTLLIGVADDGTILGLRDDYKTLGSKQNADAFENWLTTRLLEGMGRDLARLLSTSFATIEGKEICRVDVRRSSRPVFMVDAQNIEHLYVRAGNSTRMLTVSEALQYCREHFVAATEGAEQRPAIAPVASSASHQAQLMAPGAIETKAAPNLETHGLFKKKATPVDDAEPKRRLADQYEVEDIVAIIRDVVSGSEPMDREEVIRQIGRQLGAERVGSRIRDLIESGLNASSRRSITYTDNRGMRAFCRTIDDYKRDDLKNVLRSVVGRTWTDEDEAIRLGARYLGFRRTGSRIEQAFRSAIRGGLRQGTLERNGNLIRAT